MNGALEATLDIVAIAMTVLISMTVIMAILVLMAITILIAIMVLTNMMVLIAIIAQCLEQLMSKMAIMVSSYNGSNKFFTSRQTGKSLIFRKNFLLANASMVFHHQQCKHTVFKEKAYLDDLHSCGRLSE